VVPEEDVAPLIAMVESPVELSRGVELLLQPERQAFEEKAVASRRIGKIGLEDSIELEERLVVESDEVEGVGRDAALLETVIDGVLREAIVMFQPSEPLLLRGGHDLAVPDEAGGAIVIEGGDPEDVHARAADRSHLKGNTRQFRRAKELLGRPPFVLVRDAGYPSAGET
jgi:hypothetical protein